MQTEPKTALGILFWKQGKYHNKDLCKQAEYHFQRRMYSSMVFHHHIFVMVTCDQLLSSAMIVVYYCRD